MQPKLRYSLITAMSALTISACGPEDKGLQDKSPPDQGVQERPAIETEVATAPAARLVDQAEAEAAMERKLDGSSVEAFEEGLEQLKSKLSDRQFNSVTSAIEWMLFYDLSARRNKERLYSMLDGMTPTEIIERADKIRGQ